MLVLDDTIANIALPSIQRDLTVLTSALPWIINAYVLVFGALLLFGGRLGDLFGRRRVLRIGLAVFTAASLLGGLVLNGGMSIAARSLRGLGAALVAPNVLALIATTFPVGKTRNSAMAVYAAMSAVGRPSESCSGASWGDAGLAVGVPHQRSDRPGGARRRPGPGRGAAAPWRA
ncbi:MFS transporter [Alienimonas californiensis]|uniref:MFS transporter n=1 Tax=Alienimonas californiensis TaxID=2527989 RepID=UPI001A998C54